ncbi:hypothetical protein AVEN_143928-1 [Araneus ventricosus]|uniref:Uncharacterized protein n=1 Tax=Araneus ventricosus TaxID=182803 RepID=A0A4Y2ISN4_ARAVE|nr:hypothetical protein AVEN_139502-1 [Araneus ventricosus]GBM80635.1 hypothetical protein AVEN_143928-1 [Araneus ventricosus]
MFTRRYSTSKTPVIVHPSSIRCYIGEILNVRFYCAFICGENPRCAREEEEKALIMMYAKRWLDLIARDKLLGGRFMLAVLNFTAPRLWHFPNLPP